MLLLASAADKLRLVTSAAITVDVHASFVDHNGSTATPGRENSLISTATITDIVDPPGSGVVRTVKTLHIRNRHASTAVDVTVIHTDGTNAVELCKITLPAGYVAHYDEGNGFEVRDQWGREQSNISANGSGAAINSTNLVVLSSDVVNNNAVANTIADITGLSFSVTAGEGYVFRYTILFDSASTATGSRFSINGPSSPTRLGYQSRYSLTSTTETNNQSLTAYDQPAAANATSAQTTANVANITGFIEPSANGTVIARFASEVASSAITAKKGSLLEWYRVY